jgi:hypothetical protein
MEVIVEMEVQNIRKRLSEDLLLLMIRGAEVAMSRLAACCMQVWEVQNLYQNPRSTFNLDYPQNPG